LGESRGSQQRIITDQAAFGSVGGAELNISDRFVGLSSLRAKRTAIPSPQRLESNTKPQVSGVNTSFGSRNIVFPPTPRTGKIGTGILITSFFNIRMLSRSVKRKTMKNPCQ
jgi:hypothetical protein